MQTGREHLVVWRLYIIPLLAAIIVTLMMPLVHWLRAFLR